jgi:hypothetical protein
MKISRKSSTNRRAKIAVLVVGMVLVAGGVLGTLFWLHRGAPGQPQNDNSGVSGVGDADDTADSTPELPILDPEPAEPQPAEPQPPVAATRTINYCISSNGNVGALDDFRALTAETLRDPRGWVRAGVAFAEVQGGCEFMLVLSEAALVPNYAPGVCDTTFSCQAGIYVVINNDRWRGASDSWNAAGASLRDYRHMVLNHEVGHRLGHRDNEQVCPAPGAPAPLMQQQSIDLRGCAPNPWPLDSELWVR